MPTDVLGIEYLAEGQAHKHVVINTAFDTLDQAIGGARRTELEAGPHVSLPAGTYYISLAGTGIDDTTEANVQRKLYAARKFENLFVTFSRDDGAGTATITLRVGSADKSLTVTCTAEGEKEDVAHSETTAIGDRVNLKIEITSGTFSFYHIQVDMVAL